ncbi:hypothetical protein MIND_00612300 [Mycena indigotica]|uniref:ER transporter 6TM N-terminal domain-containing protein n=1 Tax=Mycena indigotica TaxID=2126181 RepID=A0A8H6SRQ8_9AGAR|nr:uncharacterized protein MIND_00612300 [Mycena indigotica]KAF7303825.1 hypothetical protein MIND_00612300 [Mycena indigotica]
MLPLWITRPLKSWRAWKVLLRSWIAVFAAFVILLPNASLRTLGTASFFSLITSLFLPPYFPVQLTLFLLSTLMMGLTFGWGLGVAAMRAANAVRDQAHIQAVGAQIHASIQSNPVFQANPALATTTAIFNGWFLEVRASVIYGVFLAIGAFIFGAIRAYAPKLLFMSIFGTIAIDIFCSVGPLFPTKRYTILNSTAISISSYMAIALVTTLLVFPETMSHLVMDQFSEQLTRVKQLLDTQDGVLTGEKNDNAKHVEEFKALRTVIVSTQQQIGATSGFLSLEFSWGQWSGDDVRSLEDPMVALIIRSGTLLNFDRLAGLAAPTPSSSLQSISASTVSPDAHWHETSLLHGIHIKQTALEAEYGVLLQDVLPLLEEATRELRGVVGDAITALSGVIDNVNRTRWQRGGSKDAEAALDAAGSRLDKAIRAFHETGRLGIIAPFLPLLDKYMRQQSSNTAAGYQIPLRSLYIAYVFAASLLGVAESVQILVGNVQSLCNKRARRRLWAPTQLRSLWQVVVARGDEGDGAFGEDTSPQRAGNDSDITPEEKVYRRDPDSRPPTNALQKVMHILHHAYLWTHTAEAIFIFKYVIVSLGLWLPSVIRSSARFYYDEKGIWALIMAQTTLNIYAADQIFNYVTRLVGTFVGLLIGLVAWYAGDGHGIGNYYGAAAAYGVCVFPLVFFRVFGPEKYLAGTVMCCATFALIVGYSWIDGHAVQFATPGIGWTVAWKRWALVVVGSAASSIVMMFPPVSGRKAVRTRNAGSIASLASLYSFVVSAWISLNRTEGEDCKTVQPVKQAWVASFRKRLLAVAVELQTVRELTGLARWEGSIRGKWPAEQYEKLVNVQLDMLTILAQLGVSLTQLDPEWQQDFLHSSKVLNPNFIADVMALFSLISQSLRTKDPMHQVLPTSLLDRLFYHDSHHANVLSPNLDSAKLSVLGAVERVKSVGYIHYASSVVSVYQLIRCVDELHALTRELCGEVPLAGFQSWREQYEAHHTQA